MRAAGRPELVCSVPMLLTKRHILCIAVFSALSACSESAEDIALQPAPLGSPAMAQRVVSLSRSGSRLIVALGAEAGVVAVDRASSKLVPFQDLPVVDLEGATSFSPDLILVDDEPSAGAPIELRRVAMRVSATSIDEALQRIREVGGRLVGEARATAFVREMGSALATIGGMSHGEYRPKVVAVTGVDPLMFAGPHGFSTDLIEIAGGESLAHTRNHDLSGLDFETLGTVDLVLVVTVQALSHAEQDTFRRWLPSSIPIHFFPIDPETIWIEGIVEATTHLREQIVRRNDSLRAARSPSP